MMDDQHSLNYETRSALSVSGVGHDSRKVKIVVPLALIVFGTILGLISFGLISNQFGNTDQIGLILLAFSGFCFVTGVSYFFLRLPFAILAGAVAAPLAIAFLITIFWLGLVASAILNRNHHQTFAMKGAAHIPPARQMQELFDDCRLYITYGPNSVPLLNCVAYFGDRYELTMQVPVAIESETAGRMIGEPQFYLNEVSRVNLSPNGTVGASFSRSHHFGPAEWKKIYDADGDFLEIGFKLDPTSVPNFQKYQDAGRPSN